MNTKENSNLILLDCPFCGKQPETYWDYDDGDTGCYNEGFNIVCEYCGIYQCSIKKEDAIEKWNMRIRNKNINWKKLRNKFFNECVDNINRNYTSTKTQMKKVNMTPHNLFEWFKRNISNNT